MIKSLLNLLKSNGDEKVIDLKMEDNSGNPLGRLPCWVSKFGNSSFAPSKVRKVNRYLSYQETRILNLKEEQRFHELVIL